MRLDLELSISENAWWGTDIDRVRGIKVAKECGFDSYCIFTVDMTPQLKRAMRDAMRGAALPCSNFTVVVTSLIDLNSDIRRLTIDWAKKQVDIGYDFGSGKMILVPGEYVWEEQEVDPKVQWGWAVEGIGEIADYAHTLGIETGLEFETPKHNIINSVETLKRMLDDIGRPYVQGNVDFVHMYVVGDAPEALQKLKGRLLNVHFADCKGRKHAHYPPGAGVVPLKEYLSALKDIGYQGAIQMELEWSPEPAKIVEWVRDGYDSTAKMMKELGMRD
jgi:D-psicose/D-tagatose/L-ribulose 3-epimerase